MVDRIGTQGLSNLARDFKRAGDVLPKEIAAINKRFVNQVFVPAARAKAAGASNPRPGSAIVNSIRGMGSQTQAQIAGGSNRVPYFAGFNYGSHQRRYIPPKPPSKKPGHTTQFPFRAPRRGRGNIGYFLEQPVEENLPRALTAYGEMLEKLLEDHG